MLLDQMRQSASSGWMYILVAVIIAVFALSMGTPMDGCTAKTDPREVARVNGRTLTREDIRLIHRRFMSRDAKQSQEQLHAEEAKALRALIIVHLLADEAERLGMRVSDEELRGYLLDPTRNQEFMYIYGSKGELDKTVYKNYIRYQLQAGMPAYEEFKKRELLARKLLDLAEMQIGTLDAEVKALDTLRHTKVTLEYVKLTPGSLNTYVKVSDEEAEAFAKANPDKIKAAYDAKKAEYVKPDQVRIRRFYMVRPSKTSFTKDGKLDEAAYQAALKQADAKFAQAKDRILNKKEDFGKVVAELATATANGGLMDWSTLENMEQNTAKALKDAKVGDVREVKVDFAYILVRLEERKDGSKTPIESVSAKLARELMQRDRGAELAKKLGAELLAMSKAKPGDALSKLVADKKASANAAAAGDTPKPESVEEAKKTEVTSPWTVVTARTTQPFNLEGQDMSAMFAGQLPPGVKLGFGSWDQITGIGKSSEIALDAFKLKEGQTSEKLYTVGKDTVLIRLVKREDPEVKDEAKREKRLGELRDDLRGERMASTSRKWQGLLFVPSDDYGPWIEAMYKQAVDDGHIALNSRSPQAQPLLKKDPAEAAKSKAGDKDDKGKVIKLSPKGGSSSASAPKDAKK